MTLLLTALAEKHNALFDEYLATSVQRRAPIDGTIDFLIDEFVYQKNLNRVFYNLVQMNFQQERLQKPLQLMLRQYRSRLADALKNCDAIACNPGKTTMLVGLMEGLALQ